MRSLSKLMLALAVLLMLGHHVVPHHHHDDPAEHALEGKASENLPIESTAEPVHGDDVVIFHHFDHHFTDRTGDKIELACKTVLQGLVPAKSTFSFEYTAAPVIYISVMLPDPAGRVSAFNKGTRLFRGPPPFFA